MTWTEFYCDVLLQCTFFISLSAKAKHWNDCRLILKVWSVASALWCGCGCLYSVSLLVYLCRQQMLKIKLAEMWKKETCSWVIAFEICIKWF